jgi:aminoglycoside 3-N-acetyltransferase
MDSDRTDGERMDSDGMDSEGDQGSGGRPAPMTAAVLRQGVRDHGLSGRIVVVHSSLASFGRVDGGAAAVVQAFLDEGCTIVVPAFSDCRVSPPPGVRLERNAEEAVPPGRPAGARPASGFSPGMTEVVREMGAIPAWVAAHPDRHRGNHPLNSFAALGPRAGEVIGGQSPRDVYAPLRAAAGNDGCVALLGVGLTAMTIIHLAEQVAGRELFVRWALLADGRRIPARVGSCSEGFEQLAPALTPAEAVSEVGRSRWRVFAAAAAVDLAAAEISRRSDVTSCADPSCARCRDAVAGGPVGSQSIWT